MKFVHPTRGTVRIRRRFLLWPRTFHGVTRWLEFATIEYRYVCETFINRVTRECYDVRRWQAVRWADLPCPVAAAISPYERNPKIKPQTKR